MSLAGTTPPAYGHGALPTVAWREAGAAPVYALDGGVHTASAALNWARDLGLFDRYEDLGGYHGHALARGLAFVPALAGLACPHWQDAARGTWLGLGLDTDRAAMLQALIEGIAYRSREVLEAMGADGTVAQTIHIDGGMTQNKWICQCLANVTGRAMAVAAMPDATALGCAAWPRAPPGCHCRICLNPGCIIQNRASPRCLNASPPPGAAFRAGHRPAPEHSYSGLASAYFRKNAR